jgi:hypothetical protein
VAGFEAAVEAAGVQWLVFRWVVAGFEAGGIRWLVLLREVAGSGQHLLLGHHWASS